MWLYMPSQFVPEELPGSTLDLESLALELARSVTSKGKKRPAKLWRRDLKMAHLRRLPYGRISQRSMHLGFAEWLAFCRRGCPASLTQLPESEPGTQTSGPSGPNLYEWWESASRTWFSSKMFLSFYDTFAQSEMSYRDWATALRSRYSSQLPTWARAIDASESSSWPTARAVGNVDHLGKVGSGGEFAKQVMLWRTPDAPTAGGPRNRTNLYAGHQVTIAEQAEHWQAPAADSFRSRGGDRVNEMGLDQQARFFPTPAVRDYRTPNAKSYQERTGTTKGEQLPNFLAHSRPDLASLDGPSSSGSLPGSPLRLNPAFVAWLMGFPYWWTNPEPISSASSEMLLYLFRQRSLLRVLLDGPASPNF